MSIEKKEFTRLSLERRKISVFQEINPTILKFCHSRFARELFVSNFFVSTQKIPFSTFMNQPVD